MTHIHYLRNAAERLIATAEHQRNKADMLLEEADQLLRTASDNARLADRYLKSAERLENCNVND